MLEKLNGKLIRNLAQENRPLRSLFQLMMETLESENSLEDDHILL